MNDTAIGTELFNELFSDWDTPYKFLGFWGDGHHKLRLIHWDRTGADWQRCSGAIFAYCQHLRAQYPECRDVVAIMTNDPGNTWDGIIKSDTAEWLEWRNSH